MKVLYDYQRRAIRLTEERLAHILEHPEIVGMEPKIAETLEHPAYVIQSVSDVRSIERFCGGYYRETAYDQVMEKVDEEGNVLGFSVLSVSSLKGKPIEVTLS